MNQSFYEQARGRMVVIRSAFLAHDLQKFMQADKQLMKILYDWNAQPQTTSTAAALLGSISTPKKAAAARANGRKGGRPPKYQPH